MKSERARQDDFRRCVLAWAKDNLRQYSAFAVLVTEVLLVRTRADSVGSVALRLLQECPDAEQLSQASIESVEELIRPLGLFRKRARALVEMARVLVQEHGGSVPRSLDSLLSLPYVGRYAANAVLCFAFGARRQVVDVNVARLFKNYFGLPPLVGKLEDNEEYWTLAEQLLPAKHVTPYTWGLLDLGAVICKPLKPLCAECPLAEDCLSSQAAQPVPDKASTSAMRC